MEEAELVRMLWPLAHDVTCSGARTVVVTVPRYACRWHVLHEHIHFNPVWRVIFQANRMGQFKQKAFVAPILFLLSNFLILQRDKEMC